MTIAAIVWCLIWGLIGYFTVGAIKAYFERKQAEKALVQYYDQKRKLEKLAQTGKYYVIDF